MKITPRKINIFSLFKLPSAYLVGIRVKEINEASCIVKVKHRWINQNPFKSMFWAVQGMAAELSTGILVIEEIKKSELNISMLVTNMKATFTKKATGRIQFSCNQRALVQKAISDSIKTGRGEKIMLHSEGINEQGDSVSKFEFEWSIKVKSR